MSPRSPGYSSDSSYTNTTRERHADEVRCRSSQGTEEQEERDGRRLWPLITGSLWIILLLLPLRMMGSSRRSNDTIVPRVGEEKQTASGDAEVGLKRGVGVKAR